MSWTELVFEILDVLGTISFALSGAMVAVKYRTDLFGVILLGVVTAVGGGITRDILLGSLPPRALLGGRNVALAILSSLLLFLVARGLKERYLAHEGLVDDVNNIFDAMGLGAFAVAGVQMAELAGYGSNLFFSVLLGLITGVGGGVLRDILLAQVPFVLTKRIYAVAALLGALVYGLLRRMGSEVAPAALAGTLLVFGVRMLATRYRWNLPRAID